ncbi:MAG: EutN/CcmL family microcompartment protein [Candidatus Sumerlaeia bacterium]|nr:EutN/CcmL family microcompartment protein [Candidatus Sumerlaeia bacterium]
MKLARVVGTVVSSDKLPAFEARTLLLVQPLHPDGAPAGPGTMAIDYVGAGVGDTVLMGAAPGLASVVFKIEKAPINEMLMGVVDEVSVGGGRTIGISVPPRGEGRP